MPEAENTPTFDTVADQYLHMIMEGAVEILSGRNVDAALTEAENAWRVQVTDRKVLGTLYVGAGTFNLLLRDSAGSVENIPQNTITESSNEYPWAVPVDELAEIIANDLLTFADDYDDRCAILEAQDPFREMVSRIRNVSLETGGVVLSADNPMGHRVGFMVVEQNGAPIVSYDVPAEDVRTSDWLRAVHAANPAYAEMFTMPGGRDHITDMIADPEDPIFSDLDEE